MNISNISNDYLNAMALNEFLPCINNHTRVTNYSQTSIDHLFINNVDINKITPYIFRCDITNHYATVLVLSIFNNYNDHTLTKNSTIINLNIRYLLIKTENWDSWLDSSNIDNMVDIFNSKIK